MRLRFKVGGDGGDKLAATGGEKVTGPEERPFTPGDTLTSSHRRNEIHEAAQGREKPTAGNTDCFHWMMV